MQEVRTERPAPSFQREILLGLNRLKKHIYEGSVPAHVKAQRRKTGKAAKAGRKVNRGNR